MTERLLKTEKSFYLYILRCRDDSLYTGITNSIENRLKMHANKNGSRYVASRLPFELVYQEGPFLTKGDALRREFAIKKYSRKQKLELIN